MRKKSKNKIYNYKSKPLCKLIQSGLLSFFSSGGSAYKFARGHTHLKRDGLSDLCNLSMPQLDHNSSASIHPEKHSNT